MHTIDVDQHLFESRSTWTDYIDPDARADALSIDDDEAGGLAHVAGKQLSPIEIPSQRSQPTSAMIALAPHGARAPSPSKTRCRCPMAPPHRAWNSWTPSY